MKRITCPATVHTGDFDRTHNHLAGVEKLAAEGCRTQDQQKVAATRRFVTPADALKRLAAAARRCE